MTTLDFRDPPIMPGDMIMLDDSVRARDKHGGYFYNKDAIIIGHVKRDALCLVVVSDIDAGKAMVVCDDQCGWIRTWCFEVIR